MEFGAGGVLDFFHLAAKSQRAKKENNLNLRYSRNVFRRTKKHFPWSQCSLKRALRRWKSKQKPSKRVIQGLICADLSRRCILLDLFAASLSLSHNRILRFSHSLSLAKTHFGFLSSTKGFLCERRVYMYTCFAHCCTRGGFIKQFSLNTDCCVDWVTDWRHLQISPRARSTFYCSRISLRSAVRQTDHIVESIALRVRSEWVEA